MSSSASPENQEQLVADFIRRWQESGAGERANFQSFELCDLLGLPRPEPTCPDDRDNTDVAASASASWDSWVILSSGGTPDKLARR